MHPKGTSRTGVLSLNPPSYIPMHMALVVCSPQSEKVATPVTVRTFSLCGEQTMGMCMGEKGYSC